MNNKKETENFQYTYSAKQQEEIACIRRKYVVAEEDKMEQLRRLDAGVTTKATVISLVLGIGGVLVLGFGMSLALSDLGRMLGMTDMVAFVVGIVLGLCGMVPVAMAYPMYNRTIKKEREKVAPEILRLSEELMK